jgi:hypothetical protein
MGGQMKKWLFSLLLVAMCSSVAFAEDPVALKNQADMKVQTADQLIKQAQKMLQENSNNPESLKLAIHLYVQAGQSFESAANIYKSVMPDYATEQDVQNSMAAMQACIETIQEIKERGASF